MWREWLHTLSTSTVSILSSEGLKCLFSFWRKELLKSFSFLSPLLCLDLTGAQDGSVRMFEWTRPQQLVCFRQAGNARVTRLYFNSQGNKVCSWELVLNTSKITVNIEDKILIKAVSKNFKDPGVKLSSQFIRFCLYNPFSYNRNTNPQINHLFQHGVRENYFCPQCHWHHPACWSLRDTQYLPPSVVEA